MLLVPGMAHIFKVQGHGLKQTGRSIEALKCHPGEGEKHHRNTDNASLYNTARIIDVPKRSLLSELKLKLSAR